MKIVIMGVHGFCWVKLGLSKPIRKPDPPEETDQIWSNTGRFDYSGGQQQVFSTRNRLWRVGFSFPPPKTWKTQTIWQKPKFWRKTQILVKIF